MTLINCVCRQCNQYFGDELEIHLGRDSIFGILFRSIAQIIDPNKFRRSIRHRRKRLELTVPHRNYGNLLVNIQPNADRNFNISISDQITIMNSTKGNQFSFRTEQLPHRKQIESIGLKPIRGYTNFILHTDEWDDRIKKTNAALTVADINIQISRTKYGDFNFPKQNAPLHFSSIIDENIQRALAKIVFNYFAHQYGANLALSESFDEIRNFIRYGLKTDRYLMSVDYKP